MLWFAGDLRVPEINSPADIYKYFPRIVGFEDELAETESSSSEEIDSRENNSDSDGQLSDDHKVRSPSNTQRTGTSVRGKTVKKCLIKKRLRKQQLNCYTHINKTQQFGTKDVDKRCTHFTA